MKRMLRLGTGYLVLVVVALLALAEGPDDLFIRVYNLIQQADTLRSGGQPQEARSKYQQASALLDQIQTSYPNWNPKIVTYRRNYIADQIGASDSPAVAAAQPAAAPTGEPAQPGAKPDTKPSEALSAAALVDEVRSLRAERDTLQAKLREALTVQPAAVDPRELAKAERRLQELSAENESLKASLAERQAKPDHTGSPASAAEAQKALKEANESVKRQTQAVAALTKERDNLRQQLKRATDKAQARSAREQAKTAAAEPTPAMKPPAESAGQAEDLAGRLKQAQDALTAERQRSEILLAEKTTLEQRVATLAAAQSAMAPAATTNAPSLAPAPPATASVAPASAKPVSAREAKADKATDKAMIKQLERERDDLRKRVNALTREVEDRKVRSGSAQQDRVAEELAILRARIQVYEARQVPYTAEEQALLKQTAATSTAGEVVASKRSARQVPAGAAALVAEAQRAFQGKRLDEAEKKFQQALVLDDKNIGLLTFLAATYLEKGNLEAADSTLARATAQDPNDPEVLALLGILRFRQGKYDEAMDVLGRAAQYNPDNALTQNYLGVTLNQKGQRGAAERAFRKALQLEPNYADAHFNLAMVYAYQKPPFIELARWHYQKALAGGQAKSPEIEKLLDSAPASSSSK